jgi:eukaryotic-like serine/threonine-protein kinase
MAEEVDSFGLEGQVLDGQYRIDNVVGEGGFGVVYQGWHQSFKHAVAVKCLKIPVHYSAKATSEFLDRFREEGALLSRLSEHPSVTRVYAFGTAEGPKGGLIPYLVLEWLDGCTLEHQLHSQKRGFSEQETHTLLKPVLEAIAFAHQQRIAHRDLKPANLFLANTLLGHRIKVLDFGIAKAMQEGEMITQVASQTSSGFHAFSPTYGAPEQFRPKRYGQTGPWTDVYALGLVVTEMLSGTRAYRGEETADFMDEATLVHQRPTPRNRGVMVSDWLEAICQRALQIDPRERYADAGQMLEAWEQGIPNSLPPRVISIPSPTMPSNINPMDDTCLASESDLPTKDMQTAATELPVVHNVRQLPHTVPPTPIRPPKRGIPRWLWVVGIGISLALVGVGWVMFRQIPSIKRIKRIRSVKRAVLPQAASSHRLFDQLKDKSLRRRDKRMTGKMNIIKAGTLLMGSTQGDSDEYPPHQVVIPEFYLDRNEVTVEFYGNCFRKNRCSKPGTGSYCNWNVPGKEKHPINCVTWKQAATYCRWASKRLPTEEEWEYAARGTNQRIFPWGDQTPKDQLCWNRSSTGTCEVGKFARGKSPFGITDMAGNVAEWTASNYSKNYSSPRENNHIFVNRGGSWMEAENEKLRATKRRWVQSDYQSPGLGFRCARDGKPLSDEGNKVDCSLQQNVGPSRRAIRTERSRWGRSCRSNQARKNSSCKHIACGVPDRCSRWTESNGQRFPVICTWGYETYVRLFPTENGQTNRFN